jgi:hypothetical protein
MLFLILCMFVACVFSIDINSFETLLKNPTREQIIVHHPSFPPGDGAGTLFYPASPDLTTYLNISEEDPYALVNISGNQLNTYSYRDGLIELKKFKQPEGVHSELELEYSDLNTFKKSEFGVHVFLIFSNASESMEYANIVRSIPHNVTKNCFDLSATSYDMFFHSLPSIGIISPLFKHMIEIREPISTEFVYQVVTDTFDTLHELGGTLNKIGKK